MRRFLPITLLVVALIIAVSIVYDRFDNLTRTIPLLLLLLVTAFALSIPHSEDDDTP